MKTLRNFFLRIQLYSLELSYYSRNEVLPLVSDPLTRANMELAQDKLFSEILRLRRSLA